MSDALRGFVLLLSLVLWSPALRPFLDGQLAADQAALRYAGALLLSWGGVSLISAIVKAYTPEPEPEEEPEPVAKPGAAAPPSSPEQTPSRGAEGEDDADLLPDGTPRRRAEDLAR